MNANEKRQIDKLLEDSRYGISFPCKGGCQMRFKHQGKDLGGYYSFRQWGGAVKAVEAAISRNKQLRALYKRKSDGRPPTRVSSRPRSNTGVIGVSSNVFYDKRRDRYYFRYQASWRYEGRPRSKSFQLSLDSSADQRLHAFRTALQFRKEWEAMRDRFRPEKYALWRERRMYEPGRPLLPPGFWGDVLSLDKAG